MLCFFFFNDTATTEIYTLSLHDALPIFIRTTNRPWVILRSWPYWDMTRKQKCTPTRSEEHTSELQSHDISYAVFCLKKKKEQNTEAWYRRATHLDVGVKVCCIH